MRQARSVIFLLAVMIPLATASLAAAQAPDSTPSKFAPSAATSSVNRAAPPVVIARSTVALPPIVADNVDADERWAVVRVAAEDLAWEDVQEAGIAASPGAAEDVALRLTADERSELARLLDQELKRNGV